MVYSQLYFIFDFIKAHYFTYMHHWMWREGWDIISLHKVHKYKKTLISRKVSPKYDFLRLWKVSNFKFTSHDISDYMQVSFFNFLLKNIFCKPLFMYLRVNPRLCLLWVVLLGAVVWYNYYFWKQWILIFQID